MTSEHFQVHEGMEVVGADQTRVGQVAQVRMSDFVVERPHQGAIAVPFGAIGDTAGNRVVLTITAGHVDTLKWPQQPETEPADQAAVDGPDDPIVL